MKDKFLKLAEHLRDGFFSVLLKLYENENDIPNVVLKVYIEKTNIGSVLYTLDRHSTICSKESDVKKPFEDYIEFMSFDHQENFEGYCRFYEAIDDYRCVFMVNDGLPNDKKFIIWQIGKYYFIRVIRYITRYFKDNSNVGYYMDNIEGEEGSIIANAVLDFFSVIYGLNVDFITALSTLTYENQATICSIYKSLRGIGRSTKKSHLTIRLKNQVEFSNQNTRQIRKLLEIAKPPLNLVVGQNNEIIGFSDKTKDYECKIDIEKRLSWKITFDGFCIRYNDGKHYIPSSKSVNPIDMCAFSHASVDAKVKILLVIEEAFKQKHGALLIFSKMENIKNEVARLSKYNRGFEIRPINIHSNPEFIEKLTSIDGATFIDYDCICYGIGMILDGDVVIQGDLARGARYNSALNYIERQHQLKKDFIAIIVSEDKTIDVYTSKDDK